MRAAQEMRQDILQPKRSSATPRRFRQQTVHRHRRPPHDFGGTLRAVDLLTGCLFPLRMKPVYWVTPAFAIGWSPRRNLTPQNPLPRLIARIRTNPASPSRGDGTEHRWRFVHAPYPPPVSSGAAPPARSCPPPRQRADRHRPHLCRLCRRRHARHHRAPHRRQAARRLCRHHDRRRPDRRRRPYRDRRDQDRSARRHEHRAVAILADRDLPACLQEAVLRSGASISYR